jgi:hypothetical protein
MVRERGSRVFKPTTSYFLDTIIDELFFQINEIKQEFEQLQFILPSQNKRVAVNSYQFFIFM